MEEEKMPDVPLGKPMEKWTKKQILDYYGWRESRNLHRMVERQMALEALLDAVINESINVGSNSYAQSIINYYNGRSDLARQLQDEIWHVFGVLWEPRPYKEKEKG